MDGASNLRQMWHVSMPGIAPTVIILLILSMGGFLEVGFGESDYERNEIYVGAGAPGCKRCVRRLAASSWRSFTASGMQRIRNKLI